MSATLHIGNLPDSATETELRRKFEECGVVARAAIDRSVQNGRSRLIGIIEMSSDEEATSAIRRLNMTVFDDVIISVSAARSTPTRVAT
jgi:RNA recognition motif-containing protein